MRSWERDVLLFVLAASAGSADGWSYSGLGHAFVANMTGNTVLLGIAVFEKNGDLRHPLISLFSYAAGVAIASFLTRKVRTGVVWSRAISFTLLLEAALMACAAIGWAAINLPSAYWQGSILGCIALAIGLQSGAMLQLKVPGIVTTYITGTWTMLINGLVRFEARSAMRGPQERLQFEERLWMQAGVLAVYFLSAVLTGWLFRYHAGMAGAVPVTAVLVAALYGVLRSRTNEAP